MDVQLRKILVPAALPVPASIAQTDKIIAWLTNHGPTIAIVLIGSLILYRIISVSIDRAIGLISRDTFMSAEQAKQRAKTLGSVLDAFVRFIIFFVAVLIILSEFIQIGPVLAGAGIAGVAIGLGAQSLVRDFISGFFILFENQFSVGDIVQIGTSKGAIEHLSFRTTQIRDYEGKLHTIPNGEIKLVINQSRGWARVIADFNVSYKEDSAKVIRLINEELEKVRARSDWQDAIIEAPRVTGIEGFTETAMTIRVIAMTKPGAQDEVARAIRSNVATRLLSENIEFRDK